MFRLTLCTDSLFAWTVLIILYSKQPTNKIPRDISQSMSIVYERSMCEQYNLALFFRALQDSLFYRTLADESIHGDLLRLT